MVRIDGNYATPQDDYGKKQTTQSNTNTSPSVYGDKIVDNAGKGTTVESTGAPNRTSRPSVSDSSVELSVDMLELLNLLPPKARQSERGETYTYIQNEDGSISIKMENENGKVFTIKVYPPEVLTADNVVEYAHFSEITCSGEPLTVNKDIKNITRDEKGNVTITFKNGFTHTFQIPTDIPKSYAEEVEYPEINYPEIIQGSNLDRFYDFLDAIGIADKENSECLITGAETSGTNWNNYQGIPGIQVKLAEGQDLNNISNNPKVTFTLGGLNDQQISITGYVTVDNNGNVKIQDENGKIMTIEKKEPLDETDGIKSGYIVSVDGVVTHRLYQLDDPETFQDGPHTMIGYKNQDGSFFETDVTKGKIEDFDMSEIPCFEESYSYLYVTQKRSMMREFSVGADAEAEANIHSGWKHYPQKKVYYNVEKENIPQTYTDSTDGKVYKLKVVLDRDFVGQGHYKYMAVYESDEK